MRARSLVATVATAAALAGGAALAVPAQADNLSDRCTNQINYAGDPRGNAEINSIGAVTGKCPPPIHDRRADSSVPWYGG